MRIIKGRDYKIPYQVVNNQGYPIDVTDYEITFSVKSDRTASTPDIEKKNINAGGSSAEIKVISAVKGLIIVNIDRVDTVSLTAGLYHMEILSTDGTNDYTLLDNWELLDSVIKTGDYTMVIDLSHKYIFKITPPDTVETAQTAYGFDGTLSVAVSGDEVTITSTENELTEMFRAEGKNIRSQRCIDVNTYKIWLADNWETDYEDGFTIDFFKQRGA